MSNFDWGYPYTVWLSINKIVRIIITTSLITLISYENVNADQSGVIKISKFSETSQLVGSEIIGQLLEKIGQKVEYISIDKKKVYQSITRGEIDLVHGAYGEAYTSELNKGGIEEIKIYDAILREDWWYPRYVERVCSGLPDWKALNKCSEKFSTENSGGKGLFITGPANWKNYDAEKIEALGMNFVIKNLATPKDIWAELDKAAKEKKPIVIYNWSPNFIGAKYPGKFVEFPKYDPRCTTEESWGINSQALYDCGNPTNMFLKLAVNINFKTNHPKAYKIIKNVTFSTLDMDKMVNYVEWFNANYTEEEGPKEYHAASQWIKDNEKKWSKWIK